MDGAGNDVPPGAPSVGFRISDGILTGRIFTEALLAAVGVLKPKRAGRDYHCNFAQYSAPMKLQTCASCDILSDLVKDFQALPEGATFACGPAERPTCN